MSEYKTKPQINISDEEHNQISKLTLNLELGLVTKIWPDFVKSPARAVNEIPFIIKQSAEYFNSSKHRFALNQPRYFDAAAGTCTTIIELRKSGLEYIMGNEVNREAAIEGCKFAEREGILIDRFPRLEWPYSHNGNELRRDDEWIENFCAGARDMAIGNIIRPTPPRIYLFEKYWEEGWGNISQKLKFDVVLNLGNNLSELFPYTQEPGELYDKIYVKSLEKMLNLLESGGKLIIDERNFPEIIKGNFKWSGDYVYCGKDTVDCHPAYVSNNIVIMEYAHKKSPEEKFYIALYPFKKGELKSLLQNAGFIDIKTFGDYKPEGSYNPKEVEFYTYVARKP